MKTERILTFIALMIFQLAYGQTPDKINIQQKYKADSAWNYLPSLRHHGESFKGGIETASQLFYKIEQRNRDYRTKGLNFWLNFPDDPRRYEWLSRTIHFSASPSYWKDCLKGARLRASEMYGSNRTEIPIDTGLIREWNSIYYKLRQEYMNSKVINDSTKADFKRKELTSFIFQPFLESKLDLNKLIKLFQACIEDLHEKDGVVDNDALNPLLTSIGSIYGDSRLKLTDDDLKGFTKHYLGSKNTIIHNWATGKLAIYKLQQEPLQLKHLSIDGKMIDLSLQRDKVILLDFWATTCTACIGRMRDIKPIYERYRNLGFEVISISVDSEDKLSRIRQIKERIGADWPTIVIGGKTSKDFSKSLASKIWTQYSFRSVPQLLLLDKKGLLREFNGVLQNGDFEPLIKKLLAEKI